MPGNNATKPPIRIVRTAQYRNAINSPCVHFAAIMTPQILTNNQQTLLFQADHNFYTALSLQSAQRSRVQC